MKIIPWRETWLTESVQLWNQEIGADFPMRTELFKQNSLQDENVCHISSGVAVTDDDQVVGFIVAKRWHETLDVDMSDTTGWIQTLVVATKMQGQGIGGKLLRHAERGLQAGGVQQILLGRDPYHYFPGIPSQYEQVRNWFERQGYVYQGVEYDLIRTYKGEENRSLPQIKGVEFSLLKREEKDEFFAFLHRCFPGRWEYEAWHYFNKGGTGREFVVLKKGGRIIGFCRINDGDSPFIAQNVYWSPLFSEELGGAGPLGVDAKERGKGYGLAIVEAGIAFLRQRGVKRIVIDWTGLVDFYKKLGYDIWKSYSSYKKEV